MTERTDYTHQLTQGFLRINRRYRRYMHRSLKEHGVSDVAFPYIVAIARNPGTHQDQLAFLHGVDKSHIARIIRDLELEGYVSIEKSPDDRRRHMINLSDKGWEMYELIMTATQEWEAYISDNVQEQDLITTIQTINTIVQSIDD